MGMLDDLDIGSLLGDTTSDPTESEVILPLDSTNDRPITRLSNEQLGVDDAEDGAVDEDDTDDSVEDEVDADESDTESEDDVEDDAAEGEADTPETFTVKVDGQEVEVTLEEALAGYMRQADYTRKTQAAAAERAAAANYKALERAFKADPDGTMKVLREQYGLPDAELEAMDPLEREVHELKEFRRQQEAAVLAARIETELATIKATYDPNLDEDELLLFATENGMPNLDVAYKAMTWDKRPAAVPAVSQRQAKVERKRSVPPVAGGARKGSKVTQSQPQDLSLAETLRLAMQGKLT